MYRYSFLSVLVCATAITYGSLLYYPKWDKKGTEAVISWDVSGYYA